MIEFFTKLDAFLKKLPGDRLKTILGAVIIVVGALIGFINNIIPVYPDSPYWSEVLTSLSALLDFLHMLANFVGMPIMAVGVTHKVAKKYSKNDEAKTVLRG